MFERIEPAERRSMMRRVRGTIETFVPVDIVIADVAEISADRDAVGSAVYWPLREGQTVFRRVEAPTERLARHLAWQRLMQAAVARALEERD